MAGSLDDNPPKLFGPNEYEYIVLGDHPAKIYVSRDGTMNRHDIAAQLRRLADYIDGLTDEQAAR